jgi:glycosyltransferase involved in cell wall biosynthesis
MPDPVISFVVTAYKSDLTLASCLRAIASQQIFGTVERVLVIDEPWTERHEWLLAPDYADVKLLTPGHVGRSRALNLGVEASLSKFIAIADADDECLPTRAAEQFDYLSSRPRVAALGGQLLQFGPWGTRVANDWPVRSQDIDDRLARGRMPLAHPAMAFRRSWFDKAGGYASSALRCEDFDLILRGWKPGTYEALATVLVNYRTATRFPTWRYWRREELYRHAILAKRRLDSREVVVDRKLKTQTLGGDLARWALKSASVKFHG